ncbi:MAG: AAA family ATPase [Trueperaceae bacterium]
MKRQLRVKYQKESYDFSVGVVVESLQGAGVPTEVAIRLAKDLDKYYKQDKHHKQSSDKKQFSDKKQSSDKTVELEHLVERLAKAVEKEIGKKVADRFRVQTPPFVPIALQQGTKTIAFSRRSLAVQLEKLGLSFKEALGVAGQVEQTLRNKGYELVSERELVHLTAVAIEASFGRELRNLFETQRGQPVDIFVREGAGESFPFSRGILAQSLMAVGLEPEMAYSLSKEFEDDLWHQGLTELTRENLRERVQTMLGNTAGKNVARRYELMKALRQSDKPVILLIGGAPGVGKSTLATELAYRLGIRRMVSSDAIREALRSLISKQLSPELHSSSYLVWRNELLPGEDDKPRRKRVIRGYQSQSQQLAAALTAVVKRNISEAMPVVIEGVHLLPGLLPVIEPSEAILVHLVLTVPDEAVHRRHFALRDKQTDQRRDKEGYLEHFEEIRIIHDFIADRAASEHVPIIPTGNFNNVVEKGLEYVLHATLKHREAIEAAKVRKTTSRKTTSRKTTSRKTTSRKNPAGKSTQPK